jgi:signal transduction histidine kinase
MKFSYCAWLLLFVFITVDHYGQPLPKKNNPIIQVGIDTVKLRKLLDEAITLYVNDPVKSIQILSEIEDISKKNGLYNFYISALHRKGIAYTQLGNYDIALKYLFKSLSVSDSSKIDTERPLIVMALGNINWFEKKFENALHFYEKALQLLEDKNVQTNQAGILMNIGNVYIDMANYDKALNYINKALVIWQKEKDQNGISFAYFNMGVVYLKLKEYPKALDYSLNSLKDGKSILNLRDYSYFLIGTGEIYLKMNNLKNATRYINEGINLAQKIKAPYNEMYGFMQLSKTDSSFGNFKNAYVHFQRYNALKDSMYSKEKDLKISNLEMSYTIEEANRNITDLRRENKFFESNVEKQKKIRNLYAIVAILLGIITILITIYLITNQKNNTKLKNLNASLEKYKNHLEQIIEERTHDLVIAKNKAEESDKLKSAFLANMSHEIRTPLNAIVGFSEFLTSTEEPIENRKIFAEYISHNVDTLLRLINDILDLSIIESGQIELRTSFFDVNNLLSDLTKSIIERRKLLELDNVSIIFDNENVTENVFIKSDEVRIRQVLSNLLDNALKFTTKGYIKIGYLLRSNDVQFYVEDTGKGIREDDMNRIFERFFKIENIREPLHRGTGLGLAISNQLAKLLGGKIWVESEYGKGSKFYFTIKITEVTYRKPLIKKEPTKEWDENLWKNQHILVVEDEFTNFHYLKLLLPKSCIITWAQTGYEAVELAGQYHYRCVLMDIKLPEYDGINAAKSIKKQKPDLPIVFQTAYAMNDEIQFLEESGFEGYITKPYTKVQLIDVLSRVVK